MKKVLSFLAVVAIVVSAFAFTSKAKGVLMCISEDFTQNENCIITDEFTTPGPLTNYYDKDWTPSQPCVECPDPILVDFQ